MSDECVGRFCIVCGRIVQGANYFCQKCKSCICFYCGAEMLREVHITKLRCPRCGAELK